MGSAVAQVRFVSGLRRSGAGRIHRVQALLSQRHQEGGAAFDTRRSFAADPAPALHTVSVARGAGRPAAQSLPHIRPRVHNCSGPLTGKKMKLSRILLAAIAVAYLPVSAGAQASLLTI